MIRYMFALVTFFSLQQVTAQLKLPSFFGNGMVLQRGKPIPVWGEAKPGDNVTVVFNKQSQTAIAGANGHWKLALPIQKTGGPYTLDIATASQQLHLQDILVGDVWLASGQSNMEFKMKQVKEKYPDELAHANNPQIRQFTVKTAYRFNGPASDVAAAEWKPVTPETIGDFTAVGYFYAKALYQKYKVPIGLILSSVGGTPAEAWTGEDGLQVFPNYLAEAAKWKDANVLKETISAESKAQSAWYAAVKQADSSNASGIPWYSTAYHADNWQPFNVPGFWEEQGLPDKDGIGWFRKEIQLTAVEARKKAVLQLGIISDEDTTYVNGVKVGWTNNRNTKRTYLIPEGVLHEGVNTITVRVLNKKNQGGFIPGKIYSLMLDDKIISLEGSWLFKMSALAPGSLPAATSFLNKPTALYNAMIAPLMPFAIKGVIWYQGEANAAKAKEYQALFPALIHNWRDQWQAGDFPFLYVQLANYSAKKKDPGESDWSELREAQMMTLALPQTGMAVTSDIGQGDDIHPLNKEDVGKRLALAAEKVAYNEKGVIYSGPLFKSMKIAGNAIVLTFSQAGSGLMLKGDTTLHGFAICGQDKKYVWASARITGTDQVTVWSEGIAVPVAVRYAWANNPEGANLYNKENLPASGFRTDK